MNDRELIELAAKTAGIFGEWVENSTEGEYYKLPTSGIKVTSEGRTHVWNPLTPSNDALQLAVHLFQDIKFWYFDNSISVGNNLRVPCGDDPVAATQRAIVRAAAEIGRNMR